MNAPATRFTLQPVTPGKPDPDPVNDAVARPLHVCAVSKELSMGERLLFAVILGVAFVGLSWLYDAVPEHRTLLLLVTFVAIASALRRPGRSRRQGV